MPKLGYVDLPFGQPTFPDPGTTRLAVDNAGNVIASIGGAAFAALGGGSSTVQTAAPISGDGSSGNKITVASGAVFPAMVIQDPTAGINKMLILNANVASGDPAISFKSNGTEVGYVRVDTGGNINFVPTTAGGTGVCWVNSETSWKFAWGVAGISFFQGTLRAQQSVGAALTDNTGQTGTAGTLTVLTGTYATDVSIIGGNLHQIAVKLAAYENAMKSTGFNLWTN